MVTYNSEAVSTKKNKRQTYGLQIMKFGPNVYNMMHKERLKEAIFAKQMEHEAMRQIQLMNKTNGAKNNGVFLNKKFPLKHSVVNPAHNAHTSFALPHNTTFLNNYNPDLMKNDVVNEKEIIKSSNSSYKNTLKSTDPSINAERIKRKHEKKNNLFSEVFDAMDADKKVEKTLDVIGDLNRVKWEFTKHYRDIYDRAKLGKDLEKPVRMTFQGSAQNLSCFFSGLLNIDNVWFSQSAIECPVLKQELVEIENKRKLNEERRARKRQRFANQKTLKTTYAYKQKYNYTTK